MMRDSGEMVNEMVNEMVSEMVDGRWLMR